MSKMSGVGLDCRRVELSTSVTLARSRGMSNCYITQCVRLVGEKMLECEPCPSRGWAPRPPVKQPRRTGKKCCCSQKSSGINMLQFCSVSNSTLTDNTFYNPFEPFRIKWEVYFSKELCPLVLIVLNMFLHASAYAYVTKEDTCFNNGYWNTLSIVCLTYAHINHGNQWRVNY